MTRAMSVATACRSLAKAGLVLGTQGNASERLLTRMLIKPSGVVCETMGLGGVAGLAAVELESGELLTRNLRPSTDAETHRYIYNHIGTVGAVVHTHSVYATAYAVAGWAIPCCTTGQADVFGGDIPLTAYCPIGGEDIGQEIVRLYEFDKRRRAFLVRQHGLFAIGWNLKEAVNAAIMAEHFAQVMWLAQRMTGLKTIPQAEIDANYERYHTRYGQPDDAAGDEG